MATESTLRPCASCGAPIAELVRLPSAGWVAEPLCGVPTREWRPGPLKITYRGTGCQGMAHAAGVPLMRISSGPISLVLPQATAVPFEGRVCTVTPPPSLRERLEAEKNATRVDPRSEPGREQDQYPVAGAGLAQPALSREEHEVRRCFLPPQVTLPRDMSDAEWEATVRDAAVLAPKGGGR